MIPFTPTPRFVWPNGARCAAMLCFDVDGETTALGVSDKLRDRLSTMSQCEYGPKIGVPRLLELLDHLCVPATFFVPAFIAEHHPKMAKAIAAGGHEIGVHGYLHERLPALSGNEERGILEKSISILERVAGRRPIGYRAPWFEINPGTPELLREFGFLYDSSLMGDDVPYVLPCHSERSEPSALRAKCWGNAVEESRETSAEATSKSLVTSRDPSTSLRFAQDDRQEKALIEIPGQWMLEDWEQFAFNADPAWGFIPENCEKVYDLWWREFEAMHDFGCCFVLTMHPWLMGRPSRVRLLERLVRDMQRRGDVWFARGHEIAQYFAENPNARREVDLDALA